MQDHIFMIAPNAAFDSVCAARPSEARRAYTREQLKKYISYVNDIDDVVTVDIFIDSMGNLDNEQSGLMNNRKSVRLTFR